MWHLKEQDIVLDRTDRAGRPARAPGQAQDILTCLHYCKQREVIMAAVRDTTSIEFEGHRVVLYQDLSMLTLQRHRLLRPVTDFLREEGIRYKWGHPFRLLFTWQNELHSNRTLEEAQRLERMPQNLEDWAQKAAPPARQPGSDMTVNDTPEINIATLWETLKAVVRSQFIAIAARQNALRHDKRQQLEGGIRALEEAHRQTGSLAVRQQLIIQQKQLRALDENKAEHALVRTKQKFYTWGNNAGRLLAHRLRTQATER
ncbi:hypothetical protein NDU88_011365 [Pleurodeles waltl]|uniref:Uncharacterized protein n=1 Tax=Pleurodeles waltl TaxID=8319 RepID=A0AAV7QYE3_PLEWA|nr:hypothetical protein NDU88_011365 [Pleurodeles waltl]